MTQPYESGMNHSQYKIEINVIVASIIIYLLHSLTNDSINHMETTFCSKWEVNLEEKPHRMSISLTFSMFVVEIWR